MCASNSRNFIKLGAPTEQIHVFENTVQVLEEELQAATQESKQIEAMHSGKYADEVRQCCMPPLSHNVGTEHISDVSRSALQLANIAAVRLPSLTLLKQMLLSGRAVSLMQVGEAATKDNNTLHYDGTSKFGKNTAVSSSARMTNNLLSAATMYSLAWLNNKFACSRWTRLALRLGPSQWQPN